MKFGQIASRATVVARALVGLAYPFRRENGGGAPRRVDTRHEAAQDEEDSG